MQNATTQLLHGQSLKNPKYSASRFIHEIAAVASPFAKASGDKA
jgi:hypothetical protein